MPSPSNEERICVMFDSFSKTVSRNLIRNLDWAEGNRNKHFAEEPADYILELLGYEDKYPSGSFVLYTGGRSCVVESEILYKAFLSLLEKHRDVLILDFWRDLTDGEIAEELEVTTRMVYNLRQRAYKTIRKFYERKPMYSTKK